MRIEQTSPQPGVDRLLTMIEEKRQEKGTEPVVVMIAGRTSAGKTTAVTAEVTRAFGDAASVLSMDDYSKGNTYVAEMAARGTPINWDHPAYVDTDLLNEHVATLKRGEAIEKPTFSFKTGERAEAERFNPAQVLVVEGLFALRDEVQHGDVKAFVDISLHGSIIRRLLRDVKRTAMPPHEILRYYLQTVEPMYQEHIVQTKDAADVVLLNEYDPQREADRAEAYEVQAKFSKPESITDKLEEAGAVLMERAYEEDSYIYPADKDLTASDEAVRIRKKNGTVVLGYKGPRVATDVRTRPIVSFTIDDEIEASLYERYGEKRTEVTKTRSVYHLDGVEVAVDDNVLRQTGRDIHPLGSYVEIRSDDHAEGAEKIEAVADSLGLDARTKTLKTYVEM